MKTNNDWKDLLANRFGEELKDIKQEAETRSNEKGLETNSATISKRGKLRVELDKHGRKGKAATLITEFQGEEQELKRLTKLLQSRIGAGGSHCFNSEDPYDGQILIQGDCRKKVVEILEKEGYKCRLIGG